MVHGNEKINYLEPPRRIHLVCQVALFYITARVSFLIKMQPAFALNDTAAQMFSCEIYEVFKNTYFVEYLQTADVVNYQLVQ